MKKNIFRKYFSFCAIVLLSSTIVLGSLFMIFASKYFYSDKAALLQKNIDIARQIVLNTYEVNVTNDNIIRLDSDIIKSSFSIFAKATDSIIFLTDLDGNTVICTETSTCSHKVFQVPENIRRRIINQEVFFENGKLGGNIYKTPQYTLAKPMRLENGKHIGYLFISTSSEGLHAFIREITRIFIYCSFIVLLLAFIISYFVTLKIVRPLREMSVAARKFAKGDFSVQVSVSTDDEIGELAKSFNNMAKSLSVQETLRRSFIANISHELKTPMTSIGGFIDGILDGTIPKEEHSKYLRIVSEEIKRLSRLVRSMLNLSRIEAGELKIQTTQFNIIETVCQIVFSFEKQIDDKRLDVRGLDSEKVIVEADPDLIHQVLYNLIENAVKFVKEDGFLEFNFSVEGNKTFIEIKNSGEGLSKEELSRVFDRFYKTDKSRGIDKNGVGLGLYIVRSIVNLHGGDITVDSVKGEYTSFTFSVPAAKVKNISLIKGKSNKES